MSTDNYNIQGFRYLEIITGLFVAVLLISNVASTKILTLWKFTFDGGTLLFPLSYIFGDILTEVYGYQKSRKIIWTGFVAALLMSLVFYIVQVLPAAVEWEHQDAYESLLGVIPRIVLASLVAYFVGEISNSIIMSRMKITLKGRHLWLRTIGSTLIGQGLDTIIFCLIAFYGVLPNSLLLSIIVSNYLFKCGVEIVFTPLTYITVRFLKKREKVDHYDHGINYNPFVFK